MGLKKLGAFCLIILMLALSFTLIFYFSDLSNKAGAKYPVIDSQFCENLPDALNEQKL